MFIRSIIPQIVYKRLSPLISIPRKVSRLSSFLRPQNNIKNGIDENQQAYRANGEESPEQKGHDEHITDQVREKENQIEEVDKMIIKSNRRIMSISAYSFIPFRLYENRIDVEESRVTFVFKQPFAFQSHSVDIADISNVFIESAFLFAKMQIVSRTFTQNNITINRLNKNKAYQMCRIIEGLRTFASANIDTSIYEVDELIKKLEELHVTK